jgi:hypothetical protein
MADPRSRVVFEPWVGPKYHDGPVRLLVVGESHYGEPSEFPAEDTSLVVENWQSGKWKIRYLVALARLLSGKQAFELNRSDEIERISFYNFVQISMPDPAHRPTPVQARGSWNAFEAVRSRLNPTHILATGTVFLWENMPPFDGRKTTIGLAGNNMEVGEYKTSKGMALASVIPHLSRGFSPPVWEESVRQFQNLKSFPITKA